MCKTSMPSRKGRKKMDLRTLSLNQLKKLQDDVAVAIFNFEKRKKAEAVAEVERVAKASGYSLKELFDENVTSKKPKVAPKYANPADASQTWTGRGRKPTWINELLASGKSLNDAAI
jgi:DNA-binding protein H-NS